MPIRAERLTPEQQSDLDVAADRRRSGRQDAHPELIPLMRGEFDGDAPPDPDLPKPPMLATVNQELVLGGALAAVLTMVGLALRFAV